MAPKRKAGSESESEPSVESEASMDDFIDDADDSDFETSKKKPKKAKAPKRAAKAAPAKDAAPKKPKKSLAPGWAVQKPGLVYRKDPDLEPSSKVAIFDLDGTLLFTKTSSIVPKNEEDWRPFNKKVKGVLKNLQDDGYTIVIMSNQGGIKAALEGVMAVKLTNRLNNAMTDADHGLDVPHFHALFATAMEGKPGSEYRKGVGTAMYDFFVKEMNGGTEVDKEASFFCGDAGGRDGDHAGTDKEFAEKVGIPFKLPEDLFGEMEGKAPPKPGAATHVLKGEASTSVNADLVNTLAQYREMLFEAVKNGADAKLKFKAIAIQKAIASLESHPTKIKSGKEAQKLNGIGKGLGTEIDEWLSTGQMAKMEELRGGGAPKVDPAKIEAVQEKVKATGAHDFL